MARTTRAPGPHGWMSGWSGIATRGTASTAKPRSATACSAWVRHKIRSTSTGNAPRWLPCGQRHLLDQHHGTEPDPHQLKPLATAIHAYDVETALTFVKHGQILPHYEE
jgi:hypothetical protein